VKDKNQKIPVGILGATGSVGQKFIQLLEDHPYFEVTEVAASERSAGKTYADAAHWFLPGKIPAKIRQMKVKLCDPSLDCRLVFSGLDASVAGEVEENFAKAGYIVVSNSKNHRFDQYVPLLIPEVNAEHLELLDKQEYAAGKIVTNPNCSTIGLVMAIKPLLDDFGLKQLNVVTLQAISGAGFPGMAGLSILENAIPHISGEEPKVETEPLKILGQVGEKGIDMLNIPISAQCNRVPVIDGHLLSVQVSMERKVKREEVIASWQQFRGEPQKLNLPSAPGLPIHYFMEEDYPQPRLHRNLENGMAISVGRLRECPLFDYKFTVLSHNTVRGAAGGAILCAELMKAKGIFSSVTEN
jgi:aspartate-semialdehyde dehydrogenase